MQLSDNRSLPCQILEPSLDVAGFILSLIGTKKTRENTNPLSGAPYTIVGGLGTKTIYNQLCTDTAMPSLTDFVFIVL